MGHLIQGKSNPRKQQSEGKRKNERMERNRAKKRRGKWKEPSLSS